LSWNLPRKERIVARTDDDNPFADYWELAVPHRLSPRSPGLRAAPATPATSTRHRRHLQRVHNLTVKADCDPCTVQVGQSSTVTATVQDSIAAR